MVKDLVLYIIQQLVDKPEAISLEEIESEQGIILRLRVDPEERGKIIGKEGKMARSIRTLVHIVSLKIGKKILLEIVD
jgi:uncharacterized protein